MNPRLVIYAERLVPPGERAPAPATVAVAGLASLAVAMGIGRFAFTPILPMMQMDVGLSIAAGGWLATANYVGYLAGAVSAIWMRLAPGRAIRVSLATIGVATLAMGYAHDFVAWILLRALAGIASAWVLIFVSAWSLERLAPTRRPALASTVYAGVGVGIAGAGGLCLLLMYRAATSATAWVTLGSVSLAVTAMMWPIFGGREAPRSGVSIAEPRSRGYADTVRLVLCYGAWGFGYIIPATFVPAMARGLVRDPGVFGWSWLVFGAASIVGVFVAAWCARFMPNRRLWAVSHVAMGMGALVPVIWPSIAAIMCAALLVGGTFMVATMTGMQEARHIHGAGAKPLMAAMTSAFALGQVLGPVVVSAVARGGDAFRTGLMAAALLLFLSAYALRTPRDRMRRPPDPRHLDGRRAAAPRRWQFPRTPTRATTTRS